MVVLLNAKAQLRPSFPNWIPDFDTAVQVKSYHKHNTWSAQWDYSYSQQKQRQDVWVSSDKILQTLIWRFDEVSS